MSAQTEYRTYFVQIPYEIKTVQSRNNKQNHVPRISTGGTTRKNKDRIKLVAKVKVAYNNRMKEDSFHTTVHSIK